jgi:hypothetical protein
LAVCASDIGSHFTIDPGDAGGGGPRSDLRLAIGPAIMAGGFVTGTIFGLVPAQNLAFF